VRDKIEQFSPESFKIQVLNTGLLIGKEVKRKILFSKKDKDPRPDQLGFLSDKKRR
jgi:hypothetical protein